MFWKFYRLYEAHLKINNQEIFIFQKALTILCLVVDIYQDDNSALIFWKKSKVNLLLHILLTTFIFFIFSKYKKLFFIILFLQQFIFI